MNAEEKKKQMSEWIKAASDGINKELPDPMYIISVIKQIQKPYKSSYHQLLAYQRNVPILIRYIADLFGAYYGYKFLSDWQSMPDVNNNKKWTDAEDNYLIELVFNGTSIKNIASVFHRSPSAIQARVTQLVGVKRISQNVAGKFIGTANGEEVEQEIVGTLYRK